MYLPEKIKEIAKRHARVAVLPPVTCTLDEVITDEVFEEILSAFREYVEELIGEDEKNMFSPRDWYDIRNQLRFEQRKRAESLLSGLSQTKGEEE